MLGALDATGISPRHGTARALQWLVAATAIGVRVAVAAIASGPWIHPPESPQALLEHRSYSSGVMNQRIGYQVFLPPGYAKDPSRRYPVLYWLHDRAGDESHPVLPPSVVNEAIQGMILPAFIVIYVCGGGDTFFTDAADSSSFAETTLVRELVPHIDQTLRTIPNREGRCVQGIGMGGFGAFRLALAHPDLFTSAVSFSGAFPTASDFSTRPDLEKPFAQVFGSDTNRIATNHPVALAMRHQPRFAGSLGLKLVVGARDRFEADNRAFRSALRNLGVEIQWRSLGEASGEPDVLVRDHALEGLEFATAWLGLSRSPGRDGPWVNAPTNFVPRVRHHVLFSEILQCPVGYCLYLPPDRAANATNPLPVLYHLPGRGEDEGRELETIGYLDTAIRLREIRPMAWVWLYGGRSSWYVDSPDGRVPSERVLLTEVIPRVEERWGLGGDNTGRALDGWGMGGFGALRLAARHPGTFRSVLVHNPSIPDLRAMPGRFPDAWVSVFNADATFFNAVEPLGWLTRNVDRLRPSLRLRIVVGERSAALADARRARGQLATLALPLEYEEVPGAGSAGPELFRLTALRDFQFVARTLGTPAGARH